MSNKLANITSITISLIAFCSIFGSIKVKAATISLENPGFETPEQVNSVVPGAGFFDFETPSGWDLYDPDGLIPENASLDTSFTGGWKPSEAFFPVIPEGDQIGSIFLVPPGSGEVGFAQNTDTTIQTNTTYTLSAAILNTPASLDVGIFEGFPGYRLELLAGNDVIATDSNTVSVDEGGFATATVSYTSSNNDPYLGELLGIRLINPNLNNESGLDGGNGVEVNFDDVRLNATSVPETTSILGYIVCGITFISTTTLKKCRIKR